MSNYFKTVITIDGRNTKWRLIKRGNDWYSVECRDIDIEGSQWQHGLYGTEAFLLPIGVMTEQDKQWASK